MFHKMHKGYLYFLFFFSLLSHHFHFSSFLLFLFSCAQGVAVETSAGAANLFLWKRLHLDLEKYVITLVVVILNSILFPYAFGPKRSSCDCASLAVENFVQLFKSTFISSNYSFGTTTSLYKRLILFGMTDVNDTQGKNVPAPYLLFTIMFTWHAFSTILGQSSRRKRLSSFLKLLSASWRWNNVWRSGKKTSKCAKNFTSFSRHCGEWCVSSSEDSFTLFEHIRTLLRWPHSIFSKCLCIFLSRFSLISLHKNFRLSILSHFTLV